MPQLDPKAASARHAIRNELITRKQYTAKHDKDLAEIRNLALQDSSGPR